MDVLKGKRTYLVAIAAICTAWAAFAAGTIGLGEAVAATFAAISTMTLRSGIASAGDVTKAAVLVVALGLTGCGSLGKMIPHGDFHVGFAGLEVGYDTRPIVAAASAVVDGAAGIAVGGAAGISAGVASTPPAATPK